MLGVVKVTLGVHERGGGRVRGVGLMVGASISRGGGLDALGLGVAQHVLVHVLGGARCRGTTSLYTPHHLLVILC